MVYSLEKRNANGTPSGSNQDLGTITNEDVRKITGMEEATSIEEDETGNVGIEMSSPIKTINITGFIIGNLATLQAFILEINRWMAGNQSEGTITYNSDLHGALEVVVKGGDVQWIGGDPRVLPYSLELSVVGDVF